VGGFVWIHLDQDKLKTCNEISGFKNGRKFLEHVIDNQPL